jgi:hypothetical protein
MPMSAIRSQLSKVDEDEDEEEDEHESQFVFPAEPAKKRSPLCE